jgi:hypothetical protein
MAQSHVISALNRQYGRLLGRRLKQPDLMTLQADLAHVEAVARMFEPDWCCAAIKPILPRGPSRWTRKGDGTRAAIEAIKRADKALSATEIAHEAYVIRGMTPPHKDELRIVGTDLIYSLRRIMGDRLEAVSSCPVRYRLRLPV